MLKRRKATKMGVRQSERVRSPGHLQFTRGFTCIGFGKPGHECEGKTEAHHVRTGTDGAMGVKPGDNWAVPVCALMHRTIHDIGETTAEARFGFDMKSIAAKLWRLSQSRKPGNGQ